MKKLFFALAFTVPASMYIFQMHASEAIVPVSDLEKALNLTQLDTTIGCDLLGDMGDFVSSLNSSQKARACVVCGDTWSQDQKNRNKALTAACGGLGSPAAQQKEFVAQALSNCDNLALLSNHFDTLAKEQRIQAAISCFSKWDKSPKAQKALIQVIKPDDIDETKQAIGTLPSWQEVQQSLTLAKASPRGQVTTEITQEQFNAAINKK